ncbi:MAG: hypothetical protein AB7J32_16900 [Pseudonocardia sp.]
MGMTYGIAVDGRLPEQDREVFCDMEIVDVPASTLIYGDVIDESHLHGIIAQLRLMGLTVVSVYPVRF